MSTKVLEASPESGTRNDPFSSNTAKLYVPGRLENARIGGTSCGLSVAVVESSSVTEHVGALAAQTLPSHSVVTGGGGGTAGSGRKRHYSTSKSAGQIKRRRKTYERNGSKPKFLLGGSITDPLNLNSLDDEEISKIANAVTPASSPLPHINKDPDPVIVPQDFKDPLKLNTADDSPENNSPLTKTLVPRKSSGKKKKYHSSGESKRDSIESLGNSDRDGEGSCARPLWLELQGNKTAKLANKIVSPVLPDSRGRKRKASRTEPSSRLAKALLIDDLVPQPKPKAKSNEPDFKRSRKSPDAITKFRRQHSHDSKTSKHLPKFREQDKKFQYGNYARYYGYRTPDSDDNRIDLFKREWFEGKKCLDIGCNSGHVTLAVAKLFNPSKMVGVDIDGNLIGVARKNVKHCLEERYREKKGKGHVDFPVSLQKTYGPLAPADSTSSSTVEREKPSISSFPANVLFRCANFVLEKDSLLETQKEEYDTILCLSVTKWIHLNWGDAGIKRFFKRIYRALHPGGRLILEPQAWPSYQKKRKMTETTYHNYHEIRFKPHQFKDYLLSQEVGFASCEVIGTPLNKSKGFRRPMVMFTKLEASSRPVSRRPSTEKPPAMVTSSIPTAFPQLFKPGSSVDPSTKKKEKPPATVTSSTHVAPPQPLIKPSSSVEPSTKKTEKPPATVTSSVHVAPPQHLFKPSSRDEPPTKKTEKPPAKVTSSVHVAPPEPLIKPSSSDEHPNKKTEKHPALVSSSIPAATPHPQPLVKPDASTSTMATTSEDERMKTRVKQEPKEEPVTERMEKKKDDAKVTDAREILTVALKKEWGEEEKVKVEVMDTVKEIPAAAEKKEAVAMKIKREDEKRTDDTASDAVAMTTVKMESEAKRKEAEEEGNIKTSSSSEVNRKTKKMKKDHKN